MATLYRKYRSQRFEDVIGQDPIVTTLTNQIKNGRIAHAYLFTGSRGIGKTSCARIFARAVNCLHPVNGSPCGECEVCKRLAADNVDIIEMDAASNNGVDDARDIREKVKYAPVACKYKVYIIDEVHMLTGGAFNALLKTIEEPPEHVIFILATTEPQKLPQTILSRCIRFDFKLVPTDVLAAHVARVYDAEGIKYTPDAVREIARLGEGSVRDALSVADTLASAADVVTAETVLTLTGSGDSDMIRELFARTAERDLAGVLCALDVFARGGKSMSAVCRQLIDYTRNVLVAKSVGRERAASGMINADGATLQKMLELADKFDMRTVSVMLEELGAAESGLKYSVNTRVFLETALVKLVCTAQRDDDILRRIEALENASATSADQKKNKVAPVRAEVPLSARSEAAPDAAQPFRAVQKAPPPVKPTSAPPPPVPADIPLPPPDFDPPPFVADDPPPPPATKASAHPAVKQPAEKPNAHPAAQKSAPVPSAATVKQTGKSAEIKMTGADEGEFKHFSATSQDGLELLGKISAYLRRQGSETASRIRRLLARGVCVKERADAVSIVAPDDVALLLGEPTVLCELNAVLETLGINKPVTIDRTADDLLRDDIIRAKLLFGADGVVLPDK